MSIAFENFRAHDRMEFKWLQLDLNPQQLNIWVFVFEPLIAAT